MAAFSGSNLTPKNIASAEFPTSFRGYDTEAVREFLTDVSELVIDLTDTQPNTGADPISANQIRELKKENLRLRSKLKSESSTRSAVSSVDLSDDQVASALGKEATRILEAARAAAAEIIDRSNDDADDIRSAAHKEADRIVADASQVLSRKQAEADHEATKAIVMAEKQAAQIRDIAQSEYDRVRRDVSKAMTEAKRVLKTQEQMATSRAEQVVADAQVYRKEVLTETLNQRRQGADELTNLLETRDQLAESLARAQRQLDELVVDLDEVNSRPKVSLADNHFEQELAVALEELEAASGASVAEDADLDEVNETLDSLELDVLDVNNFDAEVTESDLRSAKVELIGEEEKSLEDFIDLEVNSALTDEEAPPTPSVTYLDTRTPQQQSGELRVMYSDTDPGFEDSVRADAEDVQAFSEYEGHWDSVVTSVSGRSYGTVVDETRGDLPSMEIMPDSVPEIFKDRDVALARLGPELRRQLKRALNDDQSDLIERTRRGSGAPSVGDLPSTEEQISHYFEPLRSGLGAVADAGAEVANGEADLVAIDSIALQIAKHVVVSIRIPIIEKIEKGEVADRDSVADAVRSVYREYRNNSLVPLLEDALFEVYAIGHYMALGDDSETAWLIDPRLEPDPLCEINSRTIGLRLGDIYPSGHNHPLSLPGCRCLLVSVD